MITEKTPVIRAIMDSDAIDDEKKLLAFSELLDLESRNAKEPLRKFAFDGRPGWNPAAKDIDEMFLWEESKLGMNFWSDLQDEVFVSDKRTC